MERNGIIAVGNWLCDTIKFIDHYPAQGNLTTITRIEHGLGGCAHNVLADLAALGTDIPLYAGGCIGCDSNGDYIMSEIKRMGIDPRYMHRTETSGTSYTDVMSETEHGSRTFFHYRGANGSLSAKHFDGIDAPAKILHLGYLLLLDELDKADDEYGTVAARVLCSLQRKGYKTSVDVVSEISERFCRIVVPSLRYTDYLVLNEVEAGACADLNLRDEAGGILLDKVEFAAHRILEYGVKEFCIIHFPEGGFALSKNGEQCYEAAIKVASEEIVSTVGAGDAFCAGALYAIHEGFDMRKMLRTANASARFNLFGATSASAAPTKAAIESFLTEAYR